MSTGEAVICKALTSNVDLELDYREHIVRDDSGRQTSEFAECLCDWASADELMKLQALYSL